MPGPSRCPSEHPGSAWSLCTWGRCHPSPGTGVICWPCPEGLLAQGLHLRLLSGAEVVIKGIFGQMGQLVPGESSPGVGSALLMLTEAVLGHPLPGLRAFLCAPGTCLCAPGTRLCAPGTWHDSCASQILPSHTLAFGNFRTLLFSARQTIFTRASLFPL